MAKQEEPTPKKPGRPKSEDGPKEGRFVMRASGDWVKWIEDQCRKRRWDKSRLVREALKVWAKKEKVDQPPEE